MAIIANAFSQSDIGSLLETRSHSPYDLLDKDSGFSNQLLVAFGQGAVFTNAPDASEHKVASSGFDAASFVQAHKTQNFATQYSDILRTHAKPENEQATKIEEDLFALLFGENNVFGDLLANLEQKFEKIHTLLAGEFSGNHGSPVASSALFQADFQLRATFRGDQSDLADILHQARKALEDDNPDNDPTLATLFSDLTLISDLSLDVRQTCYHCAMLGLKRAEQEHADGLFDALLRLTDSSIDVGFDRPLLQGQEQSVFRQAILQFFAIEDNPYASEDLKNQAQDDSEKIQAQGLEALTSLSALLLRFGILDDDANKKQLQNAQSELQKLQTSAGQILPDTSASWRPWFYLDQHGLGRDQRAQNSPDILRTHLDIITRNRDTIAKDLAAPLAQTLKS